MVSDTIIKAEKLGTSFKNIEKGAAKAARAPVFIVAIEPTTAIEIAVDLSIYDLLLQLENLE